MLAAEVQPNYRIPPSQLITQSTEEREELNHQPHRNICFELRAAKNKEYQVLPQLLVSVAGGGGKDQHA